MTTAGVPVTQLRQQADDEPLDYWDEGLFVAVGFKLQTSDPYDGGGVDEAEDSMIEICVKLDALGLIMMVALFLKCIGMVFCA